MLTHNDRFSLSLFSKKAVRSHALFTLSTPLQFIYYHLSW